MESEIILARHSNIFVNRDEDAAGNLNPYRHIVLPAAERPSGCPFPTHDKVWIRWEADLPVVFQKFIPLTLEVVYSTQDSKYNTPIMGIASILDAYHLVDGNLNRLMSLPDLPSPGFIRCGFLGKESPSTPFCIYIINTYRPSLDAAKDDSPGYIYVHNQDRDIMLFPKPCHTSLLVNPRKPVQKVTPYWEELLAKEISYSRLMGDPMGHE